MHVELISHTKDPERIIAIAMRLCYSASDIDSISHTLSNEDCSRLVSKAIKLGHFSVLEHASFTFAFDGISRACSHQLVRHRMASYSQQSQRYVKALNFAYVVPPSIEHNADLQQQYKQIIENINAQYELFLASGIPEEDARYILPNSANTRLIMTANARSLLNFFELRLCTRAQWEIRALAGSMLDLLRAVAPTVFKNAGPTCISRGYCSEGEMSCGKINTLYETPSNKEE